MHEVLGEDSRVSDLRPIVISEVKMLEFTLIWFSANHCIFSLYERYLVCLVSFRRLLNTHASRVSLVNPSLFLYGLSLSRKYYELLSPFALCRL